MEMHGFKCMHKKIDINNTVFLLLIKNAEFNKGPKI